MRKLFLLLLLPFFASAQTVTPSWKVFGAGSHTIQYSFPGQTGGSKSLLDSVTVHSLFLKKSDTISLFDQFLSQSRIALGNWKFRNGLSVQNSLGTIDYFKVDTSEIRLRLPGNFQNGYTMYGGNAIHAVGSSVRFANAYSVARDWYLSSPDEGGLGNQQYLQFLTSTKGYKMYPDSIKRIVDGALVAYNIDVNAKQDTSVATIADLQTYSGAMKSITVRDTSRGGNFIYFTSGTADNGIVFSATGKGSGVWIRQYQSYINVKWFGMKGDSTTDNTNIMRAMFSSTSIKGQTVYFPKGNYLITDSVSMPYNCKILGNGGKSPYSGTNGTSPVGTYQGGNSVIIQTSANKSGLVAVTGVTLTVDGMTIKGPNDASTSGWGLKIPNGNGSNITNTYIGDFANNFYIGGVDIFCYANQFSNPIFYNMYLAGSIPDEGCNGVYQNMFNSSRSATAIQFHADVPAGLRFVSNEMHIATGQSGPYYSLGAIEINCIGTTSEPFIALNGIEAYTQFGIKIRVANSSIQLSKINILGNQLTSYTTTGIVHDVDVVSPTIGLINNVQVHNNYFANANANSASVYMNNVNNISLSDNNYVNTARNRTDSLVNCTSLYGYSVGTLTNRYGTVILDNNTGYQMLNTSGTPVTLVKYDATNNALFGVNGEIKTGGSVAIQPPTGGNITIIGGATNSSTAVGTVVGTLNTLSTSGARIVSFRNGASVGTEKAYIDFNGNINSVALTASSLLGADASKNIVSITALPNGTTATTQAAGDNSTKIQTTGGTIQERTATATLTNKTLTSPVINVTSDATGDIYYRNSGALFTRLPIGSSNQVLSVSAGIPAWVSSAQAQSYFTPTTGGTVTLVKNQYNVIDPAGSLLALTLALPTSPSDGDYVEIKITQPVTTITYSGGTVGDQITSSVVGTYIKLKYRAASTTWY